MTNDEIRNLIQQRTYFEAPLRDRFGSDGKSLRRQMEIGEDEPDGGVEGANEERDEVDRVMVEEPPLEFSSDVESLPSSLSDSAHRLQRDTAIEIENGLTSSAEAENGFIASDDGREHHHEETELTVERYGEEDNYTELGPTETIL